MAVDIGICSSSLGLRRFRSTSAPTLHAYDCAFFLFFLAPVDSNECLHERIVGRFDVLVGRFFERFFVQRGVQLFQARQEVFVPQHGEGKAHPVRARAPATPLHAVASHVDDADASIFELKRSGATTCSQPRSNGHLKLHPFSPRYTPFSKVQVVGAGETRAGILFWEGFRPVARGEKGIIERVWLDFWPVESKDVVSVGRGAFQDASKDSSKRTYGKTGGERSCTQSTCNRATAFVFHPPYERLDIHALGRGRSGNVLDPIPCASAIWWESSSSPSPFRIVLTLQSSSPLFPSLLRDRSHFSRSHPWISHSTIWNHHWSTLLVRFFGLCFHETTLLRVCQSREICQRKPRGVMAVEVELELHSR